MRLHISNENLKTMYRFNNLLNAPKMNIALYYYFINPKLRALNSTGCQNEWLNGGEGGGGYLSNSSKIA